MGELLAFAREVLAAQPGFALDDWETLKGLRAARRIGDSHRPGLPAADAAAIDPEGFADGFSIQAQPGGLTVQNLALLAGGLPGPRASWPGLETSCGAPWRVTVPRRSAKFGR